MSISNYDDIIDSREVIERIRELEDQAAGDEGNADEVANLGDDERRELAALRSLAAETEGYAADWRHGETLVRDSYFETYAQQLAEELDLVPEDAKWPANCIDWEEAARELQMDYTSVDFDGVTYWVR